VRGHDGLRQEIVRFGRTRREAEASLDTAVAAVLRGADAVINPTMPLLEAGEYWLKQIARPDSGLSAIQSQPAGGARVALLLTLTRDSARSGRHRRTDSHRVAATMTSR
jgi:hypothetical protein